VKKESKLLAQNWSKIMKNLSKMIKTAQLRFGMVDFNERVVQNCLKSPISVKTG
jgi:hypothetical protein